MKELFFLIFSVFLFNQALAQPVADFRCVGSGFDACCGNGFHDSSDPGTSVITSWQWDFGNGETSVEQHPYCVCFDSIGFYTICLTVTDAAGNSNQLCKPNYIQRDSIRSRCIVSMAVLEFDKSDFQIFPNPINEQFNIKTIVNEKLEITIFDQFARTIFKNTFNSSLMIDLTEMSSGIYFYLIQSKDGKYLIGKFQKTKI